MTCHAMLTLQKRTLSDGGTMRWVKPEYKKGLWGSPYCCVRETHTAVVLVFFTTENFTSVFPSGNGEVNPQESLSRASSLGPPH